MTDVFSQQKRSEIMSAVRSHGNKSTELALIKHFRNNAITGWRRNYKLIGHPDFVFTKHKIAVFADGCFWHGHDCRNVNPATNHSYWENKIDITRERDRRTDSVLKEKGWKVFRIWECEIKASHPPKIEQIKKAIYRKKHGK